MPRTCTVCVHSERTVIDEALLAGEPNRRIAAQHGVSEQAVRRHKGDHLPGHLVKAHEVEEVADADTLLSRLRGLNRETAAILKEAREGGTKDNELALKAIARVEKQIELEGRLLDVLNDRPQINLYLSPEWLELRAVIVGALEPHARAKQDVLMALGDGGPW